MDPLKRSIPRRKPQWNEWFRDKLLVIINKARTNQFIFTWVRYSKILGTTLNLQLKKLLISLPTQSRSQLTNKIRDTIWIEDGPINRVTKIEQSDSIARRKPRYCHRETNGFARLIYSVSVILKLAYSRPVIRRRFSPTRRTPTFTIEESEKRNR